MYAWIACLLLYYYKKHWGIPQWFFNDFKIPTWSLDDHLRISKVQFLLNSPKLHKCDIVLKREIKWDYEREIKWDYERVLLEEFEG
jgi:hypothetical protein